MLGTLEINLKVVQRFNLNSAIILATIEQEAHLNNKQAVMITYNRFKELLPFYAIRTISRTIRYLRENDLIEVSQPNLKDWDSTNSYKINYQHLIGAITNGNSK